jgi:predicted amidohydrolase
MSKVQPSKPGLVRTTRKPIARALRLLRWAKDEHGVDFAVFNELFNIKFFAVRELDRFDHYFEAVPGPTTNALCEAAVQLGTAIVAGVAERSSSGQYYNSAVAIDRSGRLIGTYRKTHVPVIAAPREHDRIARRWRDISAGCSRTRRLRRLQRYRP